jgi:hypothetical protein
MPRPGHTSQPRGSSSGRGRSARGTGVYTGRVPADPRPTAARLLVDCLAAEACEWVFSVPGEETMDILEALAGD